MNHNAPPNLRIIGVLDVARGQAVHARGGHRARYRAVASVAGVPIPEGDPLAVAMVYADRFGIRSLYMADLDAIEGEPPQSALVSRLSGLGVPVWVDAGVDSAARGRQLVDSGASGVVVGLETLPAFALLDEIAGDLGGARVAFSLDLSDGVPILSPLCRDCLGEGPGIDPGRLTARAAASGVGRLIVIDLARVGMGRGVDLGLIRTVRQAAPELELLAGGGIRDSDDLREVILAGADGALVATALHSGAIASGPG